MKFKKKKKVFPEKDILGFTIGEKKKVNEDKQIAHFLFDRLLKIGLAHERRKEKKWGGGELKDKKKRYQLGVLRYPCLTIGKQENRLGRNLANIYNGWRSPIHRQRKKIKSEPTPSATADNHLWRSFTIHSCVSEECVVRTNIYGHCSVSLSSNIEQDGLVPYSGVIHTLYAHCIFTVRRRWCSFLVFVYGIFTPITEDLNLGFFSFLFFETVYTQQKQELLLPLAREKQ